MTTFERETEDAREALARSRRADKRAKQLLVLVGLLLAAAVAVASWLAVQNAQLAAENASFAAQQQDEKKEIAAEAGRALCGQGDREIYDRDLCAKWAEAAQEPEIPADPPAPVIGEPSQIDLVNAFRDYCAGGNCKGRDGAPPTPDDVAAAFARFCADDRCTGPAGKDAADGADGATGPGPSPDMVLAAVSTYCAAGACAGPAGADGPPPSAEAILAAVQQQCADGSCRGAKGDQGDQGEPGAAPSSITFTDRTGTTYTCTPDPPGSSTYTCATSALIK